METVKVEFKNELGEQYVEMRVFKTMPWEVARRLAAAGDTEKDAEAMAKAVEIIAKALVVGGHVLNAWTGEEMSFPLDLAEAPLELIPAVMAKFNEMKVAAVDPK